MKPHGKRYRRNRRLEETETAACFSLQQLFRSGPLFGHVILVESGLRLLAQTDVNDHRQYVSNRNMIGGRIRRSKNRKFVFFGKRRDRSRHPTVIWSFVRRRAGNAPNPVVKSNSGKSRFPLFRLLNIIVVMLNIQKSEEGRVSVLHFTAFRTSGLQARSAPSSVSSSSRTQDARASPAPRRVRRRCRRQPPA